jgi:uncharacterized 2Fe-2S/4Fe-4S cluster protein (DUF4445 family)
VRVLAGATEPTAADHRHLAEDEIAEGWRLSCQAEILEDTRAEVPRPMRTPKAATMGVGRFVLLEPNVRTARVELDPPSIEDPRSHGRRLADALLASEGLEVTVEPSALRSLAAAVGTGAPVVTATVVGDRVVDVSPEELAPVRFGAAVDVGTTTVVATVVDLEAGAVVGVATAINGQAPFGADVIARIGAAMQDEANVERLRAAAVASVNGVLREACAGAGVDPGSIAEVVAVGNATMLHLLLGVDPRSIALSPFVASFLEPLDLSAREAGLDVHPAARLATFPSIGAYVGADIVADVLATGLARDRTMRLLIDVGTNGEIVVGNAERAVATAAPAGPAFEGGQILHGMRATEGAIEGVRLGDDVALQVIGDVEPIGICGSGLIDAVAQLRLTGLLQENGRYLSDDEAAGHPLAGRLVTRDGVRAFALTDGVVLTQLDVRELQAAKGAIATGIEVAMGELGLEAGDLDEVLLAGSFGTYIDPANAVALGLVPQIPVDRVRAVGNTASEGAKMALLSFRERAVAFDQLPRQIEYVELSGAPDFNERFVRNVAFPPLERADA